MADYQAKPLGTENAPAAWVLPDNLELLVKRAFAHYDGSGAAGAFLPTLRVRDDAGRNVLEVPMDAQVAAGSSVEASWAPFLRKATTSGGGGGATAPSVATFYRSTSLGDAAQTIPAGSDRTILWLHAALPSDGTITGPDAFGNITFVGACMTLEMLYTQWDTGTFARAGVLGTNSRIVQADAYSFANNGAVNIASDGVSPIWGEQVHPNAHLDGDLVHAFVTNGDTVPRDLDKAFYVIYRWAAVGYNGAIPGWPQ